MTTTYYYNGLLCTEAYAWEKTIMHAELCGHCEDDISCVWNMRNLLEEARETINELSGYAVEVIVAD